MAFIKSSIFSNVLLEDIHLDLFLPNDIYSAELKKPYGILYFLHGLGNDERVFSEYTRTNWYARENNLAVVYLNASHSFYSDMKYGLKYYTYVTEELPKILESLYGLSFDREHTFIAGLSMGGYGALKIGLNNPDKFGRIAAMSPAVNIGEMVEFSRTLEGMQSDLRALIDVFGPQGPLPVEDSVEYMTEKLIADNSPRPRLFLTIGRQDELLGMGERTRKYHEFLKEHGYHHKYMEWDGVHNYAFWDRATLHAIAFFCENDYDEQRLALWKDTATTEIF